MFKILVPTDFSDPANIAAKYARAISGSFNALTITLFHCIDISDTSSGLIHQVEDLLLNEAEKEIKKNAEGLMTNLEEGIHIEYDIVFGNVPDEIIKKAASGNMDLVIMGTKGAGGIKKFFLGSNTARIVKKIYSCPLLVIPENTEIKPITNIVYATDLADLESETALIKAFGELFHAHIDVLHITDNPEEEKQAGTSGLYEKFRGSGIGFHTVFNLEIMDGIEDFIKNNKVSVIAMFSRRKNAFEKLFDTSFTKEMSFHSHIPLLVIPYDLVLK